MRIILRLEASENLQRALAKLHHGRRGGKANKQEVIRWISGIVDQAIIDMEFRLMKREADSHKLGGE